MLFFRYLRRNLSLAIGLGILIVLIVFSAVGLH